MIDAITPDDRARFGADLAAVGVGPGERLAVAVSGGPDSLALLLLAAAHGDTVAATVDHGLRPSAIDEAVMVAGLCHRLGVPHETLSVQVETAGDGIQAAARSARYAALADWAVAGGAAALATAHHADDQAETFLMRAARGAGVAGLAGVRRRAGQWRLPVVRPLLGWRRPALALIVDRAGVAAVDDSSNRDDRFDRTRIRRLLSAQDGALPPERIARAAAHLADAEEALGWAADRLFGERVRRVSDDGDGALLLDHAGLPAELRRRLVNDCLEAVATRIVGRRDRVPPGPEVARLIDRLSAGKPATLGRVMARPGRLWRFAPAPPHRSG